MAAIASQYPAGEGATYVGRIMSAGADGLQVAELPGSELPGLQL